MAKLTEHRRWLRTVIVARIDDPTAVDDVMQEVAVAALQNENRGEVINVAGWLYRVAVRQALLHRRKKKTRRDWGNFDEEVACGEGENSALRWLLAKEEGELVRAAIGRLRHRDRELLLLKYTENWNCRQLGEHLGVSVTAVETALHRARRRLRRQLENYHEGGDSA